MQIYISLTIFVIYCYNEKVIFRIFLHVCIVFIKRIYRQNGLDRKFSWR